MAVIEAMSSAVVDYIMNEWMGEYAKLNCNLDHKTHTDQGYRLASDAVYLSYNTISVLSLNSFNFAVFSLSFHLVAVAVVFATFVQFI